jgi:acetylglutamate kinase
VDRPICVGLRVTDAETVKISEMILCGSINKGIVRCAVETPAAMNKAP